MAAMHRRLRQNTSLQNQITGTSESVSQATAPMSKSPTTTVLSIADELADREAILLFTLSALAT